MNKYEAYDLAMTIVNKMNNPIQVLTADKEYLCKQLEPIIEAYKILKMTNKEKSEEILTQMRGEQKSAWSEEDEDILDGIIEDIEVLKEEERNKDVKAAYRREIDWLKSIKERYTWKPSDKQMSALDAAIVDSISSIQKHSLELLYNELKKL